MKNFVLPLLLLIVSSCKDSSVDIPLNYTDEPQVILCQDALDPLLNEALYHFENMILKAYDPESMVLASAYGRFIYTGFSGTADYKRLIDQHSLEIRDALRDENILSTDGVKSNLNYNHPAMTCLLDAMGDQDLSQTIRSLVETNTMDPKLFNSRMRNFGRQASNDRYTAIYVALDAYYQNLTMSETSETGEDE